MGGRGGEGSAVPPRLVGSRKSSVAKSVGGRVEVERCSGIPSCGDARPLVGGRMEGYLGIMMRRTGVVNRVVPSPIRRRTTGRVMGRSGSSPRVDTVSLGPVIVVVGGGQGVAARRGSVGVGAG